MNTSDTPSLADIAAVSKQLRVDRERLLAETTAVIESMAPCAACGRKIRFEADPREALFVCRHVFDELRQLKGSGIEAPGPAALIYGWEVRIYSDSRYSAASFARFAL